MPSPFDLFRGRSQRRLETALRPIGDDALRQGLVEIFEIARRRAEAKEIDVVVLAARRLVCAYQLLVGFGMAPLEDACLVVSDRFLDVPGRWRSKRVLLLDDSVVVGTTLQRLHARIEERLDGDGTVECLTVCVDADQKVGYLLDAIRLTSLHERPSAHVEEFAQQLVKTLFVGGMPFFSDFPTTTAIHTTGERWQNYLADRGWLAADVTAPMFASLKQRAYTQIPTNGTARRILNRLPAKVARLVDIVKLRSYVGGDDDVTVRFVPIAILVPCSLRQLDAALDAIAERRPVSDLLDDPAALRHQLTPVAKHRLVQMYIATYVLHEALAVANGIHPELGACKLDPLQLRMNFGPQAPLMEKLVDGIAEGIRGRAGDDETAVVRVAPVRRVSSPLVKEPALRTVLAQNRELVATTGLPGRPHAGEVTLVGLVFGHAVSSVFGQINELFEVPQRSAIRALSGLDEYRAAYPTDGRARVLSQGLTLRDLTAALLPDSLGGSTWDRALISLAVDIGNDLGIIVPVTQYDDIHDVVHRCYRIGETASLARTPLSKAAAIGQWDDYCQQAPANFPLVSVTSALGAVATNHGDPIDTERRFRNLSALVDAAVPGDILEQSDGEVVDLAPTTFTVQFDSAVDRPAQAIRIPLTQLSQRDRTALTNGALVTWTVFQRDSAGTPDRISRVRLRHEPRLDEIELAAALEAVGAE